MAHISYQIIVCEATKFYINSFFQGYVVSGDAIVLNLLSWPNIWSPVFHYLLLTTYLSSSSSMKKMLEEQNFRNNNEEKIFETFYSEFKKLKSKQTSLTELLLKTERPV